MLAKPLSVNLPLSSISSSSLNKSFKCSISLIVVSKASLASFAFLKRSSCIVSLNCSFSVTALATSFKISDFFCSNS